MTLTFRQASVDDAIELAPRLRAADRAEVLAAVGLEPDLCLPLIVTPTTLIATLENKTVAIFGCTLTPEKGIPWMLGTDDIFKVPVSLLRCARRFFALHAQGGRVLSNTVDIRNTRHVEFIKRIGCTLGTIRMNHLGYFFQEFTYVPSRSRPSGH